MRENFEKSLAVVLKYEGGYSNHPRDPGGVTLEGIIQRVYDGYRKRKGRPTRPLTRDMRGRPDWIAERNEIYRSQYWDAVRGDALPAGVDLLLFDSAVNSGPFQGAKWLQRELRLNDVDGHIGEGTLAAANDNADHDLLIAGVAARRLGMLQHLSTWDAFGKGWSARVGNVKTIAQAWATGSVGPDPIAVDQQGGAAKAYASDVAQPLLDAQTANTGAVGSGTVAGLVQGAQQQLGSVVGTSHVIDQIYTALTIAGIVIAIAGLAYGFYASRKSKLAQRAIDGDVMAEVPEGQPA